MIRRRAIGADLLRVTRRARRLLEGAALDRVARFVESCAADGGGFRGRGGLAGDVYYTLFGAVAGSIVGAGNDRRGLGMFLERQSPVALDLPHLAALVQCQRFLHPFGIARRLRVAYGQALSRFRAPDGSFADTPGSDHGSPYALYLALLCHEALGVAVPAAARAAVAATELLRHELDGTTGSLSRAVSAALAVQSLGGVVPEGRVCAHVRSCAGEGGGFRAHPRAPVCDLLSTAVAAFALRRLGAPLRGPAATRTAQYVQSLWDVGGGFCGTTMDPTADCEYTFYALLALGALEP